MYGHWQVMGGSTMEVGAGRLLTDMQMGKAFVHTQTYEKSRHSRRSFGSLVSKMR